MPDQVALVVKSLPANAGDVRDVDLNPGSGRSAKGGHGNPLHSPRGCKESDMIVLSCVQFFAALWTVACQAPLYMEFSKQQYWSRSPFPSPGNLPNPGIEPASLTSPALAGRFFTTSATWEAPYLCHGA